MIYYYVVKLIIKSKLSQSKAKVRCFQRVKHDMLDARRETWRTSFIRELVNETSPEL